MNWIWDVSMMRMPIIQLAVVILMHAIFPGKLPSIGTSCFMYCRIRALSIIHLNGGIGRMVIVTGRSQPASLMHSMALIKNKNPVIMPDFRIHRKEDAELIQGRCNFQ